MKKGKNKNIRFKIRSFFLHDTINFVASANSTMKHSMNDKMLLFLI